MAFIEKLHFDVGNPKKILNVTHAVGCAAANWWTDIQLVQYFIFHIYSISNNGGSKWKATPLSPAEWQDLPNPSKDYRALAKTERWIRRFQNDNSGKGVPIKVDGRVDVIRGMHPTKSGKNYTIHVLNWTFESALRDWQKVEDHVEWALNDSEMPQMLKGQLRSASKT